MERLVTNANFCPLGHISFVISSKLHWRESIYILPNTEEWCINCFVKEKNELYQLQRMEVRDMELCGANADFRPQSHISCITS